MTVGQLQYAVQVALIGAAAIGPALAVARGRSLVASARMLLLIMIVAALVAIAFGVAHAAGVSTDDQITLMHLQLAAVVLVPAALLLAGAVALDRAIRPEARRDRPPQR